MEGIKFLKKPRLKRPYLIVGWPGMGEVAFKAASYLVEQLHAEEFAALPPEDYFYLTGSLIQEGILKAPELPQSKFYYWKRPAHSKQVGAANNDLIIFISNAQPDLARAEDYSRKITQLAKSFKVEMVVNFASMPAAIEHTQQPGVWFCATAIELNNSLKKYNLNILREGSISGMNGLFLGLAKQAGLKGFCLLGEIPLYTIQIENPRASQAVLSALAKILNLKIDFSGISEQAQTMENEINKLLDYLKLGPQGQSSPIGEEEIERIKRTLSQLTKLPLSIKKRIEKLFEDAKSDITKANELKVELDKWNVYKDYEDKFLDLFKKQIKDGSN